MLAGTMARGAPGKGKGPKSDWGGWGSKQAYQNAIMSGQVKRSEMGAGGARKLAAQAIGKLLGAPPVRTAIRNIGDDVADTLVRGLGKAPSGVGKIKKIPKKADVYTPQGVFKGSDVFVKKPNLTANQIQGILKAQSTRQANDWARLSAAGRRGAAAGGIGGAAGLYGVQKGVGVAKDVVSAAKQKKKARGGGKNKK
jgi:hypothetical protein